MAAGLKNGYVKFIKEADVLKWATPPPSATIIATLPNSTHERAIFGFEKGAAMADEFVAPARRTMFPVDNPAFDDLTEAGPRVVRRCRAVDHQPAGRSNQSTVPCLAAAAWDVCLNRFMRSFS